MKLVGLLLLAWTVAAQTPGTVNTATVSTIVGTAGNVVCTISKGDPIPPTGIHISCKSDDATIFTLDSVIPPGVSGVTGSFTVTGNSVNWLVKQTPNALTYDWQMAANKTYKEGTF